MTYTAGEIAAAEKCAQQFRMSAAVSREYGDHEGARQQIEEAEWWEQRAAMWRERNKRSEAA